jgi:hypothetical protein
MGKKQKERKNKEDIGIPYLIYKYHRYFQFDMRSFQPHY